MTVFLFPGQGSQKVGMAKSLAGASVQARRVFDEIDEALGEKLSALIFDGPQDRLTLTANAQPALFAVSMAVFAELSAGRDDPLGGVTHLAGHSLGEYSALAAAGCLRIADGARLLRIRGLAMQNAMPSGAGAMYAIIGLGAKHVQELVVRESAALAAGGGFLGDEAVGDEVCELANDNSDGQVVISGTAAFTRHIAEAARAEGARRALPLPVSAPFHCRLMAPAAERMAEALREVRLSPPSRPVIANVSAAPLLDPEEIRRALVEQVTGMVRWRESIDRLVVSGHVRFAELGAGKVLTNLLKRNWPGCEAVAAESEDEIATLAQALEARHDD